MTHTHATKDSKIKIGISSCLLGERVRYDTGHKLNNYITGTLGQFFEFRSFCPEMEIGLGTPRETIHLKQIGDETRCVGTKTENLDVTQALVDITHKQASWHSTLCGYILKKDSPSCGMERVKVYRGKMPERVGRGVYAGELQDRYPTLPIEEEGRLGDPVLRENFIQRVFAFHHWQGLNQATIGLNDITTFHSQYKYVLLAHDQDRTRALGAMLGSASEKSLNTIKEAYFKEFMAVLKIKATRKNHVNVLQHLQGFLKQDIDKEDKQEMCDVIEQYRSGTLPLIVPVTLLKHHFRKHPKPFVERSKYLSPHPQELMLLNHL